MDRRKVLQAAALAFAAAPFAGVRAQTPTTAPAAPKFWLDAYSRNLQWLRTPQELAHGVQELGLTSLDLSVAAYPGHVDPASVKTALPAFVDELKTAGVTVRSVTTPITDADTPAAEAIISAAAAAGVRYYTWGGVAYDPAQPYAAQISALKARFAKLAKLNQKHAVKGLYQPAPGMAGGLFVDLLPVMAEFDPRFMAFRYDTAALLQTRPENMVRHLRMAAPYIGALALSDAAIDLEFPKWEQGRFTDAPELLTRPNGGGDNLGDAGGDWLAYGGGGRPLPYHYRPKPLGVGMLDLTLLGQTLKDIGFDGPAECQVAYALGGAETGADKLTLPRQEVVGRLKRDRITVEQAFQAPWGLKVARPGFLERRDQQGRAGAAAPRPEADGPPGQ